jgi:hypothetical protein
MQVRCSTCTQSRAASSFVSKMHTPVRTVCARMLCRSDRVKTMPPPRRGCATDAPVADAHLDALLPPASAPSATQLGQLPPPLFVKCGEADVLRTLSKAHSGSAAKFQLSLFDDEDACVDPDRSAPPHQAASVAFVETSAMTQPNETGKPAQQQYRAELRQNASALDAGQAGTKVNSLDLLAMMDAA